MSAKSRHRQQSRPAPSRPAPSSPAPSSPAPPAGTADPIASFGPPLLDTEDPLEAELLAATLFALPLQRPDGAGMAERFVTTIAEAARAKPSPEAAALLRALVAVAPAEQRRMLVAALGRVTAAGYYPPEWAARIGRAEPVEARLSYDVYGDTSTVAVSFRYGESEHGLVVQVDRCREPTVLQATVVPEVAGLWSALDPESNSDPLQRVEPLPLDRVRPLLESAVTSDRPVDTDSPEVRQATTTCLPIVRSRLRRLPGGEDPRPRFGPEDRSAAVADFLASEYAAESGETGPFWAEVFAGYSAYVPGDPPDRVGPRKLGQLLLRYVPFTFALTAQQRQDLPAAVTAWTRWAAERRGLDQPARDELARAVSAAIDGFGSAYDRPDSAQIRGYLSDLTAVTADAAVLADAVNRRALAVPLPDRREEQLRDVDVADPAQRRTIVEHEFGSCEPPSGMNRSEFVAAAVRVCEQLWQDDPPQLWRQAQRLAERGTRDHDVIHTLVTSPPPI